MRRVFADLRGNAAGEDNAAGALFVHFGARLLIFRPHTDKIAHARCRYREVVPVELHAVHIHLRLREVGHIPLLKGVLLAEFLDVLFELVELLLIDSLVLPDVGGFGSLQETNDDAIKLADEMPIDELKIYLRAGRAGVFRPQLDTLDAA